MFKSPLENLANALTLEFCYICSLPGERLCESCFNTSLERSESRCYICNKLTQYNRVCKSCKSRSKLRRVWWLGEYKEPLKTLIKEMKYERKRQTARMFGKYLAQTLPYLDSNTLVMSVPTASSRVRQRGFDQAEVCARVFAYERDLVYRNRLTRKTSEDLIGKRRNERLKAMQNNLQLKNSINLKGKTIILIDDVLTTGASLESAAGLLREHGASHVDGAVVARRILS